MKLKNIVLATVAVGSLVAANALFADGFTLANKLSTLGIAKVTCTPGATLKPTVTYQVPWAFLRNQYLAGASVSTCQFFSPDGNTLYGSGTVTLNANNTSATLSNIVIQPGHAIDIVPAPVGGIVSNAAAIAVTITQ